MKILFNTKFSDEINIVVRMYNETLKYFKKKGAEVFFNDWDNYELYDIVLFYTGESEIVKIRGLSCAIKIGIIDPSPKFIQEAVDADFLIVNSLEQKDFWLQYNPVILMNLHVPEIRKSKNIYKKKNKTLRLGYHGNLFHLNCIYPHITDVLEQLAKEYDIEFAAIYNIKNFGKWTLGRPKKLKVIDIQWNNRVYENEFPKIDIGLVPALIPTNFSKTKLFDKFLFNAHNSDYIQRYKISSNPGRLYPFAFYKIPVVADCIPSHSEVIDHEVSGFIAISKFGWLNAIEKLIKDENLRKYLGDNLYKTTKGKLNPIAAKENLFKQLKNIHYIDIQKNILKMKESSYNYNTASLNSLYNRIINKITKITTQNSQC